MIWRYSKRSTVYCISVPGAWRWGGGVQSVPAGAYQSLHTLPVFLHSLEPGSPEIARDPGRNSLPSPPGPHLAVDRRAVDRCICFNRENQRVSTWRWLRAILITRSEKYPYYLTTWRKTELRMRKRRWNVTDSNKPIIALIDRCQVLNISV